MIFPPKVGQIFLVIVVQFKHVVGQVFGRGKIFDVNVRVGRENLGIVGLAVYNGQDVVIHPLEDLFGDVLVAVSILKGKVEFEGICHERFKLVSLSVIWQSTFAIYGNL